MSSVIELEKPATARKRTQADEEPPSRELARVKDFAAERESWRMDAKGFPRLPLSPPSFANRSPRSRLRMASFRQARPQDGHGLIQAVDPATGERKGAFRMDDVTDSGVLSTASDPVRRTA